MRISSVAAEPYVVLDEDDYVVLGPEQFGSPGLTAIESVGPFVAVEALGPLITVHDSRIEAHMGIGHHPHRHNERIFYIMEGELDHDDAKNGIKGHVDKGDVALFTEGQQGMLHSEWNNGDLPMHTYILVYTTDPIPEQTAFTALKDREAPRYDEGPGVLTKELVGPRSPLAVHGDIRLFTDSEVTNGGSLGVELKEREGGLVSVQEGSATLNGEEVRHGMTVLFPPMAEARTFRFEAPNRARILRAVTGPGYGFRYR